MPAGCNTQLSFSTNINVTKKQACKKQTALAQASLGQSARHRKARRSEERAKPSILSLKKKCLLPSFGCLYKNLPRQISVPASSTAVVHLRVTQANLFHSNMLKCMHTDRNIHIHENHSHTQRTDTYTFLFPMLSCKPGYNYSIRLQTSIIPS